MDMICASRRVLHFINSVLLYSVIIKNLDNIEQEKKQTKREKEIEKEKRQEIFEKIKIAAHLSHPHIRAHL